jgi:hypothetical protein
MEKEEVALMKMLDFTTKQPNRQPIVVLSRNAAKIPCWADLEIISIGILRPLRGLRRTVRGASDNSDSFSLPKLM